MPKAIKWLLIGVVILVVVAPAGTFGVWLYGQMSIRGQINNQLQQLIISHNEEEIAQVSLDQATMAFLDNLPYNAKVDAASTSDFQGGALTTDGFETGYYVAAIDKTLINVYMKAYTGSFIYNWFPKLILYKVSVDRPGTIAKDGEIIEDEGVFP